MFKKSLFALAATASIVAATAPVAADARTRHYTRHHVYRGSNGRYYCHRGHGTTGTIVSA